MARIISIVNQKGGTGKSACTANLAVGLAQKNMKVLIVDADPQSDVSAGFGYRDCDESNETLTALMDTVMKDEDIPSDCYIRHQAEGIDIICSNIGLAGTEVQLVNAMSREYVLKQILYTGDSSRQILRYIHLTELITELLELADEKKLPFNTAVEVSYLRSEEQQILLQYMSNHNMVPSMKQAKELKQISKERMLTYSEIDQICMNESTEKVQVQIPAKKLKQYFPESYSKAQIEEVIFMLLASWAEKQ